MQDYKQLKVWQKAHQLTLLVYSITKKFPKEELYGLTSQLRRAASSISANIAEGSGKNSKADFANFLNVALGSANETEYFLILSKDFEYIQASSFTDASLLVNEVKAMLIGLVSRVRA
jgi:four helix bundle protein